jgi:hypothetical protein
MWKQRLQAVTDPDGHHFHADMAAMTEYAQYMFNLQQNTVKTVVQQRLRLTLLEQHIDGLRHENAILRSGTLSPSGQDRELQVMYHRLSKAEHRWHYARQLLDAARAMVDERTHTIIHLSTTSSSKILTSRRGQRRSPLSSSSFRCHQRPQHLQHPLILTQSQMLMRSR